MVEVVTSEQAPSKPSMTTRWRSGTSGKPGGRSKAIRDVIGLARQHTPKIIRVLTAVMQTSKSDAARVAAAQAILDRAWAGLCKESRWHSC